MITEEKSDLEKYYLLKKDVDLPVRVKLYFLIFENALDQTKAPRTIQSKKGFSKALLNAFSNLSVSQKGQYLLSNINFVLQHLDRQQKEKTKSDSKVESDQIKNVETTCEMLLTTLKINYWSTVSLKLDKIKKIANITNKKKCFTIDMKNYFVRRSNKYKYSIVLQAISQQINNQGKKYVFCFSHQIVGRIYDQMLKCVLNCQHQKILSLMLEEEDEEGDQKHSHKSNEKTLVFLSSKNINDYLSYKQKVEKQIMQNKFQFKILYHQEKMKIEQSGKIQKVFRMQNTFQVDAKQLKQKFMYSLNYKNKYIAHSQILQDFSKKYKAMYEKLNVNGKMYQYISIRQQSISNQQQVLFIKGVENIMGRNYIQFLQVRVRPVNPCQSKLIIYISIGLHGMITKDLVKAFLLEFNDMIFRKQLKVIQKTSLDTENDQAQHQEGDQNDDDFMTVKGSEQFVGFIQDDGEQLDEQGKSPRLKSKRSSQLQSMQSKYFDKDLKNGYLFVKHNTQAINQQKYHKLMTEHYLFHEWVRIKDGGVICTNTALINVQKNMFKEALTKMGRNILKGEILRMSLPVIVFRKQSHLQSIARDFCYAPMFFDKLAHPGGDPLQRIKYATLLAISVGTLGISMQKPFNPILGQTIQLRIDGCPIYLQQINHHPPIGAYFFQGRGYRIHGQIQPKINFGLNNVKGFSNRPNYLQFQDGGCIQMIYGKMVIKGLLFGDRQFNFEDKIYCYDKKNNIFSEIIYGPRKKSKKKDPNDFIHGTIYSLKPEFVSKFQSSMPRIFPGKQYIISQLSKFEGVWNDVVRFDDKQYFNFCQQLPFALIPQQYPLISNSSYRFDLAKLIQDNIEEAQKQKVRLEEIQRRDRKLRQKREKH